MGPQPHICILQNTCTILYTYNIQNLAILLFLIHNRIYDREGQGFITMDTLRGLIAELLSPLTDEELDGIIEELDEDGSGTMDFDEFCEMMMSAPQN